eukprot:COSAG01_NODE_2645_length_7321_cov_35.717391_1_plen_171_part_00
MTVEVPPPQPATPPPSQLDFELDLPKSNITLMNAHQNVFLQTTLGQEAAAGVQKHVSALIVELGPHAPPEAHQTLLDCVEDLVYRADSPPSKICKAEAGQTGKKDSGDGRRVPSTSTAKPPLITAPRSVPGTTQTGSACARTPTHGGCISAARSADQGCNRPFLLPILVG